ncbi:MAG: FAD-dependent oxidoreductase [Proteobacteria bacterium]|nr:FAD-dependent oxidoreductase [Pseudomonadota bacterium]MDA1058480.1 FAD-dependent oxidoreductase [Pseudomonadota bacterium]
MPAPLRPDVCVIGAGAGGLVVAGGAALMGASVVLIERGEMGGDCLNFGCVPSKALIAAGEAAIAGPRAARFGITYKAPHIDFSCAMDHVRTVIEGIAPTDSEERFRGMGVRVIRENGKFISPQEVIAGEHTIRARRFVVATGSSPLVPPIAGLDSVPYLTNETVFMNRSCPKHLLIVGGGPIGLELAQAHRRLGAQVTVLEMMRFLPRDDEDAAEVVIDRLRAEGITLLSGAQVHAVSQTDEGISLTVEQNGASRQIIGSHLLVAAGRAPNLDLDLEAAGVEYTRRGLIVDSRLRTTNKKIFAVGDVTGGAQFTHVASFHAGVVLRNILFRLPARTTKQVVPWVTYTDPELAHVGMLESEAREKFGKVSVVRWPVAENDRARAQDDLDGLIKIVSTTKGRVLGVQIVARNAGDLLLPWVMAVGRREKLSTMAGLMAPYPTYSELGKRAAGTFFAPALASRRVKSLVRLLARLG